MNVGDVIDFRVTKVAGYACWGTAEGKTGFSHCVDWSAEKPVPERCHPVVGQTIKARVFHLIAEGEHLPADVTYDGKIRVDFACSFALVDDMLWKRHNGQKPAA
jgi:hypothetical protein